MFTDATTDTTAPAAAFDPRPLIRHDVLRASDTKMHNLLDRRTRTEGAVALIERELKDRVAAHADALVSAYADTITQEIRETPQAVMDCQTRHKILPDQVDALGRAIAQHQQIGVPTAKREAFRDVAVAALLERRKIAAEVTALQAAMQDCAERMAGAEAHLHGCGLDLGMYRADDVGGPIRMQPHEVHDYSCPRNSAEIALCGNLILSADADLAAALNEKAFITSGGFYNGVWEFCRILPCFDR